MSYRPSAMTLIHRRPHQEHLHELISCAQGKLILSLQLELSAAFGG